jgi:hypothetical protein
MADELPSQIVRVSAEELRKLFNEHFLESITAGEFSETVMETRHPSLTAANEPYCTESQMVSYRDPKTSQEIARAHRYLRPDAKIGASGKPDPKSVLINGVWHRIGK